MGVRNTPVKSQLHGSGTWTVTQSPVLKRPRAQFILCGRCLENHNHFRTGGGGDYYYFAASPARYVASSGPALTHHLQQRSLETDFIVSWTLHVILVIFSLHFLASPFSGIIAAPGIKDVLVRCSFYYEMHIANEDSNTGTV